MPSLSTPHYANVLLIGQDGKHLSTISSKKAKWYLRKNLAVEVPAPEPYTRALQINFTHKQVGDAERWDLEVSDNCCVMCGTQEGMTLHHIVPRVIRRYFPIEIKGHSREWCVLLCEACHTHVEFVSQPIYKKTFPEYKRGEKDMYLALQVIKAKNNVARIPEDKLKNMLAMAGYQSIDDIPELTPRNKQEVHRQRSRTQHALIEEWAHQFIADQGGIEGTLAYFFNLFLTFKPKYQPDWFNDLRKQVT